MFNELTLSNVEKTTPDAVILTFDIPANLADAYAFKPGQYLTLRADINGQDVRRSYSIASGPEDQICVGVRQVEDGVFSTFTQGLSVGDTVQVMPPEGRFTYDGQRDILLVAAGSGITPMVSIAANALDGGANVTLIYGNRDLAHIMFRDALDALKDQYMERFTTIHILSREEQDVPLLNGRVTGNKIATLAQAGAVDLGAIDGVFLCGPGEMISEVSEALTAQGIASDLLHSERFTPDGEAPRKPRSKAAETVAKDGAEIEVIVDGMRKKFMVEEGDNTVLEAATRAGFELPFSCKGGMCCTCRCRVVEGESEMAVNYSLEPWELEAGFTLACQTRPTSKKLVLDFDAA